MARLDSSEQDSPCTHCPTVFRSSATASSASHGRSASTIFRASSFIEPKAASISLNSPSACAPVIRVPSIRSGVSSDASSVMSSICRPNRFAYDCHNTWLEPISSAPPSTTLPGTKSRNDSTRPPTRLRASTTWTSTPALDSSYAAASPEKPAPMTMTRPRPGAAWAKPRLLRSRPAPAEIDVTSICRRDSPSRRSGE